MSTSLSSLSPSLGPFLPLSLSVSPSLFTLCLFFCTLSFSPLSLFLSIFTSFLLPLSLPLSHPLPVLWLLLSFHHLRFGVPFPKTEIRFSSSIHPSTSTLLLSPSVCTGSVTHRGVTRKGIIVNGTRCQWNKQVKRGTGDLLRGYSVTQVVSTPDTDRPNDTLGVSDRLKGRVSSQDTNKHLTSSSFSYRPVRKDGLPVVPCLCRDYVCGGGDGSVGSTGPTCPKVRG